MGWRQNQAKAVSEPLAKLQESGVVTSISRNDNAIAALKADGSVVSWGSAETGGECGEVQAQLVDVQSIISTAQGFAAWKADSGVV